MGAENIELSIIIVSWNTRELLARCLESVYATMQGRTFEVLVVDNASRDGSAQMVREQFPQVRLIENRENVGFARANNQALRESHGDYLLLLNSDTLVLPDAVEALLAFMERYSSVGACGPRLLSADGSVQVSCGQLPTFSRLLFDLTGLSRFNGHDDFPAGDSARRVGWIQGACLLIRRETIGDVGLLDEDYFMYTEEVDWCYRASVVGWGLCYVPASRVIHYGGQSAARAPVQKRAQLYGSKLLFVRKHYGWPLYALLKVATKTAALLKLGASGILLTVSRPAQRAARQDALQSYYAVLRNV